MKTEIDKIYLHVKDPFESKYQFLINEREKLGIKTLKNPKVQKHLLTINKIADVYENLEDYNPIKKRWLLIAFDDRTVDIESNNKLNPIVTELFLIGKKTYHYTGYYVAILFQNVWNYKTKCNTLFYHENF